MTPSKPAKSEDKPAATKAKTQAAKAPATTAADGPAAKQPASKDSPRAGADQSTATKDDPTAHTAKGRASLAKTDRTQDDPPRVTAVKRAKSDALGLKRQQKRQAARRAKEAKDLRKQAADLLRQSREMARRSVKQEKHQEYLDSVRDQFDLDDARPVTPMPDLPATAKQLSLVEVHAERAFIRLSFDTTTNSHLYEVIEPPLEPAEEEVHEFIADSLVRVLDGRHSMDATQWEEYLAGKVDEIIVDHSIIIDDVSTERIKYHIVRDFLGYGPVDVMMRDALIEDISCDGPSIPVYVFHRQFESIRSTVTFHKDLDLDAFVIRLAQRSGKHISVAEPILDATLPDGSRLQATLSREVTTRGSSFTVRKFREDPLTPPSLIQYGTMDAGMAAYFWMLIEEGSSLIYAGGTASGKTTSLNAVCQFIPPAKKVVSIEDTREINLLHENWIAGLTRSGFGADMAGGRRAGEVDMYKLLEAALRQRPEYLIVGEVRGKEALTLFQAMATGHAVYSTMHADSVSSAVHRLENPPINVPRIMLPIMDAMAVQVQARVEGKLVRRVKQVTEMMGIDPESGDLLTNGVFEWKADEDRHTFLGTSRVFDHYGAMHGLDAAGVEKEWKRRAGLLQWMADEDIVGIQEVARLVDEYYRKPDEVLAAAGAKRGT